MTFPEPGSEPAIFDVAHVDLYFLYDIDVVTLVVELFADDLSLATAQDAMYRFGRAYPTYWAEGGRGGHCVVLAEWLGPTAPCWRSPITTIAKSTCATSDSVAHPLCESLDVSAAPSGARLFGRKGPDPLSPDRVRAHAL
jgi:hypothetical protein